MPTSYLIMIVFVLVILIIAFFFSVYTIQKQSKNKLDKGMSSATVKHPIAANPILITYVVFIALFALITVFTLYYFSH